MTTSTQSDLPDLFTFNDGRHVTDAADWNIRREELLDMLLEVEYGRLPPTPEWTRGQDLHLHYLLGWNKARHSTYRLTTGPQCPFSFMLDVLCPAGEGPFPVVVNGDRCWRYATDDVCQTVLNRGYVLAQFNRVEIVPDDHRAARDTGLYLVHRETDYGALAAWAWGYHRVVDFLLTQPWADATRIAITGHSRGGKTVLLAGATDPRIAITAANNSGCGGAGSFHICGEGSERLADIIRTFPHWFSPRLNAYIDRDHALPFDQHALKALVAPRCLLTAEALDDLWCNPRGTFATHAAAAEVYRFLNVPERIGIWYRPGAHGHGIADWTAFLEFAAWHWEGKTPSRHYDVNPFS